MDINHPLTKPYKFLVRETMTHQCLINPTSLINFFFTGQATEGGPGTTSKRVPEWARPSKELRSKERRGGRTPKTLHRGPSKRGNPSQEKIPTTREILRMKKSFINKTICSCHYLFIILISSRTRVYVITCAGVCVKICFDVCTCEKKMRRHKILKHS